MSEMAEAFVEAKGGVRPFSEKILESMRAGEECARQVCDPVRGFNDPNLLAALRESFQFFLKGAISLHRKGRHPGFWEGSPQQVQANFCAQAMQLCAVVHIARFLEDTHMRMEWEELARNIPSEARSGHPITPQMARRFVELFARAAGPDRVLAKALTQVLTDPTDFNDSLRALSILPVQTGDTKKQDKDPSVSTGSPGEKHHKNREFASPDLCLV
ncbi:MAG TPA: hypothetical protein PKX87_02205 [Alphaproteobacteria bacterium]|nr:hypothetical protein [Alphaproteobacteria bacterium]